MLWHSYRVVTLWFGLGWELEELLVDEPMHVVLDRLVCLDRRDGLVDWLMMMIRRGDCDDNRDGEDDREDCDYDGVKYESTD